MQRAMRDDNVRIGLVLDGVDRLVAPKWVWWNGKTYRVREVGQIYSEQRGLRKVHCFALNVGALDMLIQVDSHSFAPTLVWISDGLPD